MLSRLWTRLVSLGKNLSFAASGANYLAKLPTALTSATQAYISIQKSITEPVIANTGMAFRSILKTGASSLRLASSFGGHILRHIGGSIGLGAGTVETSLDIMALCDHDKIEEFYEKQEIDEEVKVALRETRIWRVLNLTSSIARLTQNIAFTIAPFVGPLPAIATICATSILSVGMDLATHIFQCAFMDHKPVLPTHIENKGKQLDLCRNKTCIIL